MLASILPALHLLALGIGLGAVFAASMEPLAAATVSGTVTIVGRGGAIDPAGAVVWLEGAEGGAPRPERVTIDMRKKSFLPPVVAVPVGSSVSFPNADPILHNVFSVSSGNAFDLGLYGRGDGKAVVFREPGVVRVYCNVHPQMEAFVVVTPGAWRASVGPDGSFTIDGAPEGRYRLRAWDARGGSASYDLEVTPGAAVRVDVRMDAIDERRRPHLDKNGRPYTDRSRY